VTNIDDIRCRTFDEHFPVITVQDVEFGYCDFWTVDDQIQSRWTYIMLNSSAYLLRNYHWKIRARGKLRLQRSGFASDGSNWRGILNEKILRYCGATFAPYSPFGRHLLTAQGVRIVVTLHSGTNRPKISQPMCIVAE
jgi:hypothetical protein